MDAPQRPLRPLMPAHTGEPLDPPGGTPLVPPTPPRLRRLHTRVACGPCRQRKGKCDGVRPCCSACRKRASPCQYDMPEGEGRLQTQRKKNDGMPRDRDRDRDELSAFELVSYLKTAPEQDALAALGRIRRGDNVAAVAASLRVVNLGGGRQPADATDANPQLLPPLPSGLSTQPPALPAAAAAALNHAMPAPAPILPPVPAPRGSISSILDNDENRRPHSIWHQRVMQPDPIPSRTYSRGQSARLGDSDPDTLTQRFIAQGALNEVRKLVADATPSQPPINGLPPMPP